MKKLNRRNFMTLAGASGAALATGVGKLKKALAGTMVFKNGGRDFSPVTGKERQAIPTACWGCVTRDAMIGYVEDGRLKKLEGHPDSIRTLGKLCAVDVDGVVQTVNGQRDWVRILDSDRCQIALLQELDLYRLQIH